jgi:hypothetical protein
VLGDDGRQRNSNVEMLVDRVKTIHTFVLLLGCGGAGPGEWQEHGWMLVVVVVSHGTLLEEAITAIRKRRMSTKGNEESRSDQRKSDVPSSTSLCQPPTARPSPYGQDPSFKRVEHSFGLRMLQVAGVMPAKSSREPTFHGFS